MTTLRSIRDDVQNVLDYLQNAELAVFTNPVIISEDRVTFPLAAGVPFLITREHPDVEQYIAWLNAGAYSAVLFDGALLQLTYNMQDGYVVGHRLMYAPCPYDMDLQLVAGGDPLVDVVEMYRDRDPILRSAIRFDYAPDCAEPNHPASHLTFNQLNCRIPCVSPIHALRFVDFLFKSFYVELWRAHSPFFANASSRHLGDPVIAEAERRDMHITWDVRSTASGR